MSFMSMRNVSSQLVTTPLSLKKLPCIAEMMSDAETGTPYPGAKEAYILDTSNHTKALEVIATLWEKLPFPKKRK